MDKRKIAAKIVADSVDPKGNRITSYILTYPRFIHAELMTHRMFSRNAASSRAIPLNKMLESVINDPVIPIAFQKKHPGMQGTEYIEDPSSIKVAEAAWSMGADSATAVVKAMDMLNITKQLCNRILEPYLWYTVLVTATEYDNWFELRSPKYRTPSVQEGVMSDRTYKSKEDSMKDYPTNEDLSELEWIKSSESGAEIHIQALAEAMWTAKNGNEPKSLREGEWHIPFGDRLDNHEVDKFAWITNKKRNLSPNMATVAIASARCARLSYMTFDGEINFFKDIKLHDDLLKSRHMSPFEHCARAMTSDEYPTYVRGRASHVDFTYGNPIFQEEAMGWCTNFKGFIPYRYIVENKLDF